MQAEARNETYLLHTHTHLSVIYYFFLTICREKEETK